MPTIELPADQRTVQRYFDTSAFDNNTNDQLASNLKKYLSYFSWVRGPGINVLDFSALNDTQSSEWIRLQFRAEFINGLNHSQFSDPDTKPIDTNFGAITTVSQLPGTMQLGLKLLF